MAASISISSQAFSSGGAIPARYTCRGLDLSPPLSWTGVPEGSQSLALTVIDPDAPGKPFVHWVIFNLPPALSDLSEGAASRWQRSGAQRFRQQRLSWCLPAAGRAPPLPLQALRAGHHDIVGRSRIQSRDTCLRLVKSSGHSSG